MAAKLLGAQEATTRLLPSGHADDDGVRLAQAVGMRLDPWQAEILTESARTRGNRWSAFEVCAIVPRQNGKSFLIVARALAGALLYGEKLTLYSAHEYRTAQEVWRTMRDLCESDALSKYVKRVRATAGSEAVEFHNGARFKLIARTRTSGRGLSPDCLLMDEAFTLNDEVMASMLPGLSARPNPQVCYFSSAATWEATTLLRLRQRGHSKVGSRLAYWEWHAKSDVDIRDPRVHAACNPAYGRRITADAVNRELVSMTRKAFLRERLGVWSESAIDSVLTEEDVTPLVVDVPPAPRDRPIAWGVDVAWDRSSATIAAAFADDEGIPVVTVVETRGGAGWLPARLGELGAVDVAYDARGGLVDLMERAERDHDVTLMPLRHGDYPSACAGFVQRVSEQSVHIARVPALVTDAHSAFAKTFTGGWVWDRKVATAPTALIAATCALYALDHNDGASVGIY